VGKKKKKFSGIKLMVRGEIEGLNVDEWDYVWATHEEVQNAKEKGYVFISEK